MKNEKNKCQKASIGGQALIEGIMMKSPDRTVLSVRTPSGEIVSEDVKFPNLKEKCPLFKLAIFRGIIGFGESMYVGYKTLMRSADLSGMTELEEEELDQKNLKKLEKKAQKQGISTEELLKAESEKPSKLSEAATTAVMIVGAVLGFVLAMVLFMWVPTMAFNGLRFIFPALPDGGRPLVEGVLRFSIFIGYVLIVSFTPHIRRLFQYHGAEHKAIFCYEQGLPLTVENVRMQSRLHPRCGTSFMFLMIAVGVILSTILVAVAPWISDNTILWVLTRILMIPVICGIGYELLKFCGKRNNAFTKIVSAPGKWVQKITTKEPDDDMIELAIHATEQVVDIAEEVL